MLWTEKTRKLIEESGVTYRHVEEAAGWPLNTLAAAMRSEAQIGIDKAVSLARALGVEMGWLFDESRPWHEHVAAVPQFSVHDISKMPGENQTQKWHCADWDAAKAVLSQGKAISFKVPYAEAMSARSFIYSRLGRNVKTRYDGSTGRLWVCDKDQQWKYFKSLDKNHEVPSADNAPSNGNSKPKANGAAVPCGGDPRWTKRGVA